MILGLFLTFCVGICWVLVGVIYKMMARWNVNVFNVSLITAPVSLLITALCYSKPGLLWSSPADRPSIGVLIFFLLCGLLNSGGCFILQRSMIYGKSSVTWAIGQSAFIVPFIVITLVFSEPWNSYKIAGSAAVLTGMILLCFKNKTQNEALPRAGYGLLLALIAFAVIGIAQAMTSATSYFSYKDPANLRPLAMGIGGLFAAVSGKCFQKSEKFSVTRPALLLGGLLIAEGVTANILQFLAMDQLAKYKMNAVFFPIAIGICIGGYALYSACFFKEKPTFPMIAGMVCILLGILLFNVALFHV